MYAQGVQASFRVCYIPLAGGILTSGRSLEIYQHHFKYEFSRLSFGLGRIILGYWGLTPRQQPLVGQGLEPAHAALVVIFGIPRAVHQQHLLPSFPPVGRLQRPHRPKRLLRELRVRLGVCAALELACCPCLHFLRSKTWWKMV